MVLQDAGASQTMAVELITVGDELLTGDVVNTNASWLAGELYARGVITRKIMTIPDEIDLIADAVRGAQRRVDAVLVTGGIGPTRDDVTMAGVARACDVPLAAHAGAERWLTGEGGYSATDLDPETTALPAGARFLRNPAGVAPGAVIDGVYVFPGVPGELREMFALVREEFSGARQATVTIDCAEPESALLDRLAFLDDNYPVAVGSYPGESVRVVIRGADEAMVDAAAEWLREHAEIRD
jgi:molybdenum cofactor synthesis domain-containing protein